MLIGGFSYDPAGDPIKGSDVLASLSKVKTSLEERYEKAVESKEFTPKELEVFVKSLADLESAINRVEQRLSADTSFYRLDYDSASVSDLAHQARQIRLQAKDVFKFHLYPDSKENLERDFSDMRNKLRRYAEKMEIQHQRAIARTTAETRNLAEHQISSVMAFYDDSRLMEGIRIEHFGCAPFGIHLDKVTSLDDTVAFLEARKNLPNDESTPHLPFRHLKRHTTPVLAKRVRRSMEPVYHALGWKYDKAENRQDKYDKHAQNKCLNLCQQLHVFSAFLDRPHKQIKQVYVGQAATISQEVKHWFSNFLEMDEQLLVAEPVKRLIVELDRLHQHLDKH